MINLSQIEFGIKNASFEAEAVHEHPDCIRIAYEWLDAQVKTRQPNPHLRCHSIKHYIERWAGRYVSEADVEVAAFLHPLIVGKYPCFNFRKALVLPDESRLSEISEAFTQMDYRDRFKIEASEIYSRSEN